MKLAFVTREYTKKGGVSRCVVELASRMAVRHEVHVFAWKWDKDLPGGEIKFHKVTCFSRPFFLHVLSFPFFCERILRRQRFDLVVAPLGDTLGADVVVAHSCHRAWIAIKKQNFAGWLGFLLNPLHWMALFLEAKALGKGTFRKIIAVSQKTKNDIIHYYRIPADDIQVIYNGVNTEEFSSQAQETYRTAIRQELKIAAEEVVFLFVGNECKRKGLGTILEAIRLPMEKASLKLLIIGAGDAHPYRELAKKLSIEKDVIFLGARADVQKYYSASDVFVFPTLLEPFGLVIAEAMASGLPVITSRNAGAAELIENGVSGLLLKNPENVGELQDKIFKLVRDAGLRKNMGLEAQRSIQNYSWEKITEQSLKVYSDILRIKLL